MFINQFFFLFFFWQHYVICLLYIQNINRINIVYHNDLCDLSQTFYFHSTRLRCQMSLRAANRHSSPTILLAFPVRQIYLLSPTHGSSSTSPFPNDCSISFNVHWIFPTTYFTSCANKWSPKSNRNRFEYRLTVEMKKWCMVVYCARIFELFSQLTVRKWGCCRCGLDGKESTRW